MLKIVLPVSLVFLIVCLDVTSCDFQTETMYESSSRYRASDNPIEMQELIDGARANCTLQRERSDTASFLRSFARTVVHVAIIRLNRIEAAAASTEWTEKNKILRQIEGLKERVTKSAKKASCPAPDDPSLLGEFDAIVEIVYEMCYINLIDNADNKRNIVARRVEDLFSDILSAAATMNNATDSNKVCSKALEDSKSVAADVRLLEKMYDLELRSIYSSCARISYEHAEKFMPSVIKRATACRATIKSKRINRHTHYNGRIKT